MAIRLPEEIQKKFDKPHFQIGDVVFFSFLGQKRYGYVTKIKKTGWGIQYNVQCYTGTTYPCGIRINEYTTSYRSGIIFFNETKELGAEELKRRYTAEREALTVSREPRRPKIEISIDNTTIRDNDATIATDSGARGTINGSQHDDIIGTTRISKQHTKKRRVAKKSELNDAIEKQKNFLNGFVKKD